MDFHASSRHLSEQVELWIYPKCFAVINCKNGRSYHVSLLVLHIFIGFQSCGACCRSGWTLDSDRWRSDSWLRKNNCSVLLFAHFQNVCNRNLGAPFSSSIPYKILSRDTAPVYCINISKEFTGNFECRIGNVRKGYTRVFRNIRGFTHMGTTQRDICFKVSKGSSSRHKKLLNRIVAFPIL